ncbi:MAG: GNAT family N-acetyltransferase [Chloroflexota bacterium]
MVGAEQTLTIRPFTRRDLSPLRDVAFYNFRVHTHLDWQTVHEYLQTIPPRTWVAQRGERIVGALGLSEPVNGACWIRVLAVVDGEAVESVLDELWAIAVGHLRREGVGRIAVLLVRDWVADWTAYLGFDYIEDIVTLRYSQRRLPLEPPASAMIEPIELQHIPAIHRIDLAAFSDPWRLTKPELRLGVRTGTYCTLARLDDEIIGYQVATIHGTNGHLARLGVSPDKQSKGVGSALVWDMLRYFHRRGIYSVTVNTQESNIRSQRLYERFGFGRNGFDLPVWMVSL